MIVDLFLNLTVVVPPDYLSPHSLFLLREENFPENLAVIFVLSAKTESGGDHPSLTQYMIIRVHLLTILDNQGAEKNIPHFDYYFVNCEAQPQPQLSARGL